MSIDTQASRRGTRHTCKAGFVSAAALAAAVLAVMDGPGIQHAQAQGAAASAGNCAISKKVDAQASGSGPHQVVIEYNCSPGISTAEQNRLPDIQFAVPNQRKEPLTDASHVRNAVARFDQVEGVTDADRDRAWRRIRAAARKFDVEISERGWRQLFEGGKAKKR